MALISVIAAVLLVSTKLIIAILTNSLGILSEALHSGIDLIAAAVTLLAVRMADRPPDQDHLYGHAKIESFSSLVETALLFITCGWIVYEAVHRLFFPVEVDVTWVAVGVMLMSIAVDYTRSRALMKTAKEYKSQALEADAIHFRTDLLSSVFVLFGIFATMAGLQYFDAIAALGVAGVTAFIGYKLWKRSVHTLLDGAPEGISNLVIEEAKGVEGVMHVENVRVRESGPKVFIDAIVHIDGTLPLEQAHRVTDEISQRLEVKIPGADVVIHPEPCFLSSADVVDTVRKEAAKIPEIKNVHNIEITELEGALQVDLHLELDGNMSVTAAHEIATRFENNVMKADSRVAEVYSHIEPSNGRTCHLEPTQAGMDELMGSIRKIVEGHPKVRRLRYLTVHMTNEGWRVNLCCSFDSDLNVSEVHDEVTKLEYEIIQKHRDVQEVSIHMEPWCSDDDPSKAD